MAERGGRWAVASLAAGPGVAREAWNPGRTETPRPGRPDGDRSAGPGAGGEYYIMITNHSADWNLITSLLSW